MNNDLVTAVRAELRAQAHPGRAADMRAYMKSAMPFLGVPGSLRKPLTRRVFAAYPLVSKSSWLATVRTLWRDAAYREERYVAVDLAGHRRIWRGTGRTCCRTTRN